MSLCDVLGVLEDDPAQLWSTFETAVDLAETEHARLTLAKTADLGRTLTWLSPFAFGGVYVPPALDARVEAGRMLARAAELVPTSIPLTTLVLSPCTQDALCALVRGGHHDALVAGPHLLRRHNKLTRELRRHELRTVVAHRAGSHGAEAFARVLSRFLEETGAGTQVVAHHHRHTG